MPNGGRMGSESTANDEKFKKALERKLEPGTKVIVDERSAEAMTGMPPLRSL